jgi:hypothetical protein
LYYFETLRVQTLMVQVARRSASVLKRRKSRNRMEVPSERSQDGPSPAAGSVSDVTPNTPAPDTQKDGDNEVIYYMDEPHVPGN